ncbi:hypothetical protein [Rhizohabitans arisaemae]|uniref:hypothetical protein n=1 Tax=Rhizohabitans arisaemae TaxID=2720610 RepID=UPI0024B0FBFB|nr:hypothetical protein [Rhizohabitans arisaemae]
MTSLLGRLGDRIVEKLAPKASAQAAAEWYVHCYCRERSDYRKLCTNIGGRTYCGACYVYRRCGA